MTALGDGVVWGDDMGVLVGDGVGSGDDLGALVGAGAGTGVPRSVGDGVGGSVVQLFTPSEGGGHPGPSQQALVSNKALLHALL